MSQQFFGLPLDILISAPFNAAAKANASMALTQTNFMLDTCFTKKLVAATEEVKGVPEIINPNTGVVTTPEIIGSPPSDEHYSYEPVMVVMSLTRGVVTPGSPEVMDNSQTPPKLITPATATQIQNVTTQFNLPLLTIVPLNSLAFETVDVSVDIEIKSMFFKEKANYITPINKVNNDSKSDKNLADKALTIMGSATYDSNDSSKDNNHYKKNNISKYGMKIHAGQLPLPKGVNTIIEAFTQAISPITTG